MVDEFNRLEAAAEALVGVIGSAASEATSVTVATVTRRRGRGRRRGSGKRARKGTAASTPAASTAAATAAVTADAASAVVGRKRPGRPKGSGKKPGRPPGSGKKVGRPAGKVGRPKGKVGRRKGSGTRALETLSLVQGQPGITIPGSQRRWASSRTTSTGCFRVLNRKASWRRKAVAGTRGAPDDDLPVSG